MCGQSLAQSVPGLNFECLYTAFFKYKFTIILIYNFLNFKGSKGKFAILEIHPVSGVLASNRDKKWMAKPVL